MPVSFTITRLTTRFHDSNGNGVKDPGELDFDFDEIGVYDPGDILYTRIKITNTGDQNATGVTIEDNFAGSTLVAGTLNVSPIAFNEAYSAVGNTLLEVGSATSQTGPQSSVAGNLLTNDVDPLGGLFQIVSFTQGAQGGTVNVILADGGGLTAGSFTYVSAAGFVGTDTFTYTIRDQGMDGTYGTFDDLTSTATVTITVQNQVWYVDNSAAGPGTGTSTNPFTTLALAEAAAGDNDTVYVRQGSGPYATDASGYAMNPGERLIGEHSGLSIDPDGAGPLGTVVLHAATPGARPVLTATNADVITLATGATVDGVTIDQNGAGNGIFGGAAAGNVTIANVNITDTGTAGTQAALELNGTTGTQNISNLVINNSAATGQTSGSVGVLLNNAGTVNFTTASTISITTAGAKGLDATGTNMNGSTFDDIVVTGSGSGGVSLVNTTGTTMLGDGVGTDLNLTTTSGVTAALFLNNAGTVNVGSAGDDNISATGGAAVDVQATTGMQLNFDGVSSTNSAGDGINLDGNGTGTFLADSGTIAGAAGIAIDVHGGSGSVIYSGTINDGTGASVEITGRSGGVVSFSGSINDGADAGGGITIGGTAGNVNTGGIVNFTGSTKTLNTGATAGVSITNSDGMTVNFQNGGLDIDTTTAAGFTATTSGTVTVTGSNNSINSTSNTALNVTNTDIGAGGLNFVRIDSGNNTAAGEPVNGIVLNTTGSTAGLTVTGDGGAVNNGSGGTIQNTTGDGISLINTMNVVLGRMNITGVDGMGINGNGVYGLVLTRLNISGSGDSAAADEGGIRILELTGDASHLTQFNNISVTNSFEHNVFIRNTGGTLSDLVVANSTFSNNGASTQAGMHFIIEANTGGLAGTPTMTAHFTGNTFTGSTTVGQLTSHALQAAANDGLLTIFIGDGTVPGRNTFTTNAVGIDLDTSLAGNLNFNVNNNVLTDTTSNAINIFRGASSTGTVNGFVTNNVIGTQGVATSGSEQGSGIRIGAEGGGTTRVLIDTNTVQSIGVNGVSGGPSIDLTQGIAGPPVGYVEGTLHATVINNIIRDNADDRALTGTARNGTINVDFHGNTVSGIAGVSGSLVRLSAASLVPADDGIINVPQASFNAIAAANTGIAAGQVTGNGPVNFNQAPPQQPTAFLVAEAPGPLVEEPTDGGLIDTPEVDNGDDGGETPPPPTGPAPAGPLLVDDGMLSQSELDFIVEAAIQRWAAAGASAEQIAAMRAVHVSVEDLAGLTLGESGGGTIKVDSNAAGWSWFVDATPGDDSEYAGAGTRLAAADKHSAAGTRIDLLTVLTHELGHQIGLSDLSAPGAFEELMYGTINAGERRLPGSDDLAYAADGPVTGAFAFAPITLGTIPAGQIVIVEFRHTINNPTEDGLVGSWTGQAAIDSNETNLQLSNAESGNIDSLTLGDLIYNDVNKNGLFDAGDTAAPNVVLSLYADTNNSGAYEDGVDLHIGYTEVNGTPGYQQGIDTPAAAGTGTPLTATTNASGIYSFSSLAPGDYIVRVNASNFQAGGALFGKTSHNSPVDPNAIPNVDSDNNGEQFLVGQPGTYAASRSIRLDYGQEPTAGLGNDTNNTLDLGFDQPNQPPVIAQLQGDGAAFVEGGSAVRIDTGTLATVADPDSTDFAGGTLVVSITGGLDASEDELRVDLVGTGVTFVGGDILVDGTIIGTVSSNGGAGGGDLSYALNANATHARVAKVLNAVTYFNSDTVNPSTAQRTISVTLVDGDGEANGGDDDTTVTTTVSVTAVNDAPAGTDNIGTLSTNEDTRLVLTAADFGYSDVDGNAFAGILVTTTPGIGTLYIDTDGAGGTLGTAVAMGNFVAIADINAGRLVYVPNAEVSGNDTFTFQVRDDGGVLNGGVDTDGSANTIGIAVVAQNDAPVLDLNGAAAGDGANNSAYEQDSFGTLGNAPDATVTDVDSANFDTGTLTVEITANGQAGDVLDMTDFTDNVSNTVTIVGSDISYNGTVVATYTAGDHDTPLVITFDADATPTAVQWVTRAVNFLHTSDNPTTAARSLTYTLTDGDGGSDSAVASVTVTQDNDEPVLSAPTNATLTYTEGAAAIALMQGVVLSDVDLPANFAGGSLALSVTGTGGAITLRAGSLFSVSGGDLVYDNAGTPTTIGPISGFGTSNLAVNSFTSAATLAVLNDLIDDFVYANATDNIGAGDRGVELTLNDGNNSGNIVFSVAKSDTATQTIQVTPVNDPPTIDNVTGDTPSYLEGDGALHVDVGANADIVDPDSTDFGGGTLTVSLGATAVAGEDQLGVSATQGVAIGAGNVVSVGGTDIGTVSGGGAGGGDLVFTFTTAATPALVEEVVQSIIYFNSNSLNPSTTTRTVAFTLDDGDGNANGGDPTGTASVDVTVTGVNDAPTSSDDSVSTSEDDAFTFDDTDFPFTDGDGNTLSGVRITELPAVGTGQLLLNGNPVVDEQVISFADLDAGNLTYQPPVDQIGSPYTSFKFRVIDTGNTDNGGANQSAEYTMSINVTADNFAPTFALDDMGPSATLNYTENQGASVIAPDAQLTDSDSANFDTGTLTVSFQANGEAADQLGIQNQGTGAGQISVSGADVKYENVTIGTFTGGANGTNLVVTFNASSTPAAAQALVCAITYHSISEDPSTASRTVNFTVTDGDGGSSQANAAVNVTQLNDAPTVTVDDTTVNAIEDTDLVFNAANGNAIVVADVDGDTLTVVLVVQNGTLTLSQTAGLTTVSGNGTDIIEVVGSAANINAALEGLVYRGDLNYEGSDTLSVDVDDGTDSDDAAIVITISDDGFIDGNSGDNVLTGTPQRDVFRVQQGGNDTVNGLGQNDSFYFGNAFTAADTVNGGDGFDVLILQGNYSGGVTLGTGVTSNISGVESISLFPGNITTYGDTANNSYSYNITTLDSNVGAFQVLKVNGFGLRAGENFTFNGSAESNGTFVIFGGQGIDNITGGGLGDVFVFAHDGRFGAGDVISGGGGYDFMFLRGDYMIDFNAPGFAGSLTGIESVGLLSSSDFSYAGGGDGELDYHITWNDAMLGAGQTITFNGSQLDADETMVFLGNGETNGNFRLWGGAAADTLAAGAGNDLIYGGGGGDVLSGGTGNDTYRYHNVANSTPGMGNFDIISSFTHLGDRIDLNMIDAKSFSGGDQDFSFIGSAAFSGSGNSSAGQLRAEQIDAINNIWKVEGDVNGDGIADLYIQVTVEAGQPLTAGDFIL